MSASERALVTGAARGIGRAVTGHLIARGARVAVLDQDLADLESLSAEFPAGMARPYEVDVTDVARMQAVIDDAAAELGGLDTVVANAGIAIRGTVEEITVEEWNRTIEVNTTGVFLTVRFALPYLRKSNRASAVLIASDAGIRGAQRWAAYVASKHAVVGLARSMAIDHGAEGIRVNAVCPGFVDTAMAREALDAEATERMIDRIPLGRMAQVEDVAAVVAHLASEDARHTTGHAYVMDGGAMVGQYGAGA